MNKRLYFTIGSILAVFVCFFSSFSFVHALTITPVRFEIKGNPGDIITEEFLLFNESEKTQTFYPSFANFEAQGETGNPAFVEPKEGLGTWMDTVESISIPSQSSVTIPFKIRIPTNAEPGGYFAVVLFGDSPGGVAGAVSVGAKVGTLVLLSVNGEVKEAGGLVNFGLKDKKYFYNTLPVTFEYRFRNDGRDRIKPEGKIKIRNTFFIPTEILNANPVEGNILPSSTRRIESVWVEKKRPETYIKPESLITRFFDQVVYQFKNFALGLYFAKLSIVYGDDLSLSASSGYKIFFVFPWQLILFSLIVIFIVWWGGGKLLRRYDRYVIEKAKVQLRSSHSHEK